MGKEKLAELEKIDRMQQFMTKYIDSQIDKKIKEEFAAYKSSVIIRDKWCCDNMMRFAINEFGMPRPIEVHKMNSVVLLWRGMNIIYCPFCGVKL